MKNYSPEERKLIFIEQRATSQFWDKHWEIADLRNQIINCKDSWFTEILKKYLPEKNGTILEGGCGKGQLVYAFKYHGYNAVGVDFAEKTVRRVNEAVPEIDVRCGDVRKLPFKDGEVSGYWSLGVIEHLWEGYREIINEMRRVIRADGFLFMTFPYMSPLRKLKAFLGLYKKYVDGNGLDNFYQFALDHRRVISDLNDIGFILKEVAPFDGIKGFKDEVSFVKNPLQRLYDYHGKNRHIYDIRQKLDMLFRPFASHCILLVFQKLEKS